MRTLPLETGFLAFGSYHSPNLTASGAFENLIRLFQFGERIGVHGGWLRVRHFERSVTGAFPLMAAIARETNVIRIGTAVVPIAHENGVRLAEDAATVDLLSQQRLELGVSTGIGAAGPIGEAFAAAYGHDPAVPVGVRSARVLDTMLAAMRGDALAETAPDFRLQFTHAGEGLRVYPRSKRLAERIWYGSGTRSSALRAGELGLNLQLSTINTETAPTATVPVEQSQFIDAYADRLDARAAELGLAKPPPRRVSISRYVIPYTTAREKEVFLAASDRHVPRWKELNGQGWNVGTVDEVIDQLVNDAAIRLSRRRFRTTLLLNLPSTLELEWLQHLIEKVCTEVLPIVEHETGARR